ncbi:MAG: Ribosomal protein acetylase RimI and related acetyltransferase [Chthoniobacteraceae bacterium]|nr:Ribosomal protein acetylase RimI and related acetyltransferase [Chthoniobacteraceae bacterium]
MNQPQLEISGSRNFTSWLKEQRLSLAFSTYQTGKLFLIGLKPDGKLSIFERTFERCMGLCVSADLQTLWMSSLFQLWRFENALPAGQSTPNGYDRLYVPQLGYTTGDIDGHDIGLAREKRSAAAPDALTPVFINTLFSCLAAPSETHSFRPIWKPPFISRLAAEDRCHLNGVAMRDNTPAFATAVSTTDVHEGWREHRHDGGVVIDIATNEIMTRGLSMPHSPRWHEGRLYVLNSGGGEFGTINLATGRFEPIAFCPGYARGLAFSGGFAIIGLSTCRENRTFSGLPLDEMLASRNIQPRCGLMVVDLRSGDVVHSLAITGIVRELYDVVALPGVQMPSALGFKTEEIRRTISIDE